MSNSRVRVLIARRTQSCPLLIATGNCGFVCLPRGNVCGFVVEGPLFAMARLYCSAGDACDVLELHSISGTRDEILFERRGAQNYIHETVLIEPYCNVFLRSSTKFCSETICAPRPRSNLSVPTTTTRICVVSWPPHASPPHLIHDRSGTTGVQPPLCHCGLT